MKAEKIRENMGIKNKTVLLRQKKERLFEETETSEYILKMDALRLLEELKIHQVELEIQNEELRRAQETLQQTGKRFRSLIENSSDLFIEIDKNGTIKYINASISLITGYTRDEVISRNFIEFTHSEDKKKGIDVIARLLNNPGVVIEEEIRIIDNNGTSHVFELRGKNLLDDTAVAGIVINTRDISRRRNAEEKLKQNQAQLEELVEERTRKLTETIEKLKLEKSDRKKAEHSLLQYAERMKALSRRLFNAQESERRHIALELHDEIGQSLTGIKLSIDLIANEIIAKALPEEINKGITEAKDLAGKLLEKVRSMTLDLRPPMLDDFGLLHSLLWHFERCTAQTNVRVLFRHSGLEGRFSPDVEIAAYRFVQEALTNAVRHASVDEVNVLVAAKGNTLNITVEDKGTGFDLMNRTEGRTTAGLSGMRERLRLVGGQLTIRTAPGAGTRVCAEIPTCH